MTWSDVKDLANATETLYVAMRRARAVTAAKTGEELSVAQITLLEPLLSAEMMPMSQVAAAAFVSHPTATRMLKQLEERQLVARARSDQDDRVVFVRLTAAGRSLLTRLQERMRDRQVEGLAQFSASEQSHLAAQLTRLATIIAEMDKPESTDKSE